MKNIIKYLSIIVSVLLIGCQIENFQNISGHYYCQPMANCVSDTIFLNLQANGSFTYYPKYKNSPGMVNLCNSSNGYWRVKRNIILNSKFKKNTIVFKTTKNTSKDSTLIKVINFSDSIPYEGYEFDLFNVNDSLFFTGKTNYNGIISIPSKGYKVVHFSDHIGQGKPIKSLDSRFNYTFIYFDCFPEYFNNEKFKINGNTLVHNFRINRTKYHEIYIKLK
jgi:hypothetical protein